MNREVFLPVFRERGIKNFMDPTPDYDVVLNDVIIGILTSGPDGLSGYIIDHAGVRHENGGKSAQFSYWQEKLEEITTVGQSAVAASRDDDMKVQNYHQTLDPMIIRLYSHDEEKLVQSQALRMGVLIYGSPENIPWGFCPETEDAISPDKPSAESVASFLLSRISTDSFVTMAFLDEVSKGEKPPLTNIDKMKLRHALSTPVDNEAVSALSGWFLDWVSSNYVESMADQLDVFLESVEKNNIWADKRFSRPANDHIKKSAERIQDNLLLLRGMRDERDWQRPSSDMLVPQKALPHIKDIIRLAKGMGKESPLIRCDNKVVALFSKVSSS